ncbi:MAG: hypothetical protein JO157_11720 [Acetobacteraceae bacterium]|nr:hypothetical protein [Acetobacteraceae bacterium]
MAQDLEDVRRELASRIAVLDRRTPYARTPELIAAVDEIRVIAHGAGLHPAVTVAHCIAAALARGERGAGVHGWLPMLRDAVGAERQDAVACETFAAACSVRLIH